MMNHYFFPVWSGLSPGLVRHPHAVHVHGRIHVGGLQLRSPVWQVSQIKQLVNLEGLHSTEVVITLLTQQLWANLFRCCQVDADGLRKMDTGLIMFIELI